MIISSAVPSPSTRSCTAPRRPNTPRQRQAPVAGVQEPTRAAERVGEGDAHRQPIAPPARPLHDDRTEQSQPQCCHPREEPRADGEQQVGDRIGFVGAGGIAVPVGRRLTVQCEGDIEREQYSRGDEEPDAA